MKKGILIGIVLCLCLGAAAPVSKYWQDVIRKPNQVWITAYGYNNESVLAFNVRSILEAQDAMARQIVALKATMEALQVDVNEPTDPNE